MRTLILALATSATLLTLGCDKKADDDSSAAPATDKATETAKKGVEAAGEGQAEAAKAVAEAAKNIKGAEALADKAKDLKALANDGPELTIEEYEKLLLGLSACQLTERGIDSKCEAATKFNEARRNRNTLLKGAGGALAALGRKHISHESPAVRMQAAQLMGSLFGASPDSQTAIIEAAKAEKDPNVLTAMLRSVSSSIGKNPALLELMMANASHADDGVRRAVVQAFTSTWAKDTVGTLEKAMEIVEKDASPDVREQACRRLGSRADEKALPLLEKLTADSKKDPKLYSACMAGLIAMWASPIPHEKPSEKAYKLTLQRLKAKPRSENQPPWTAISGLGWAKNEKFQAAAPWFKNDDVIAALVDIVKDRDTNWLGRTSAVDTLKKLGADNAVLEGLQKAYADSADKPGPDKHVLDKINKALGAPAPKK